MYAVIMKWDSQNRVSQYNYTETEAEAKRLRDRKRGLAPPASRLAEMQALLDDPKTSVGKRTWATKEMLPLPVEKQATDAYYVEMPPAPTGMAIFQYKARFWKCDPVAKTMSFDATACADWQRKMHIGTIDRECDKRVDKVFSPDNPGRADRIKMEMMARGQILQDKGRGTWTAAEKAEWDAGLTKNNRVKVLRDGAEALKNSLTGKTAEKILAVDPADGAHWPE